MTSATRPGSRTAIAGALTGVVALAAIVGFGVGLPKALGDDGVDGGADAGDRAAAGTPIGDVVLPDDLPGGLVAIDQGALPEDLLAALGGVDGVTAQQNYGAQSLAELPQGTPSVVRWYAREDGSVFAELTVSEGSGLAFAPQGAPKDAERQGWARAAVELEVVDGATCSVLWSAGVPQGTAIDPQEPPAGVDCQLVEDGLTYRIGGAGLTAEEAANVLRAIADATTGD